MKKIIITLVLFFAGLIYGRAGMNNDSGVVKSFLEKTHRAYLQAEKLSFSVQYRYANTNQPGKFIDTISAEYAMDKDRMRFLIGGTETIVNPKYTIQVIKEEKLIYLSKTRGNTSLMDPLQMLDSLLVQAAQGKTSVLPGRQSSTLNIRFGPGQLYKNISITIDEQTGFFQQVTYDLYTKDWVADEQINEAERPAPYEKEGRVEIIFTNHQKGTFNDSLFDEALYFTRRGASFEPTERYQGYRVFVASPNL